MARKIVTHYAVFHNVGSTTEIVVYYQGSGADVIRDLQFAEAAFMVDLLRNEKPVSYDAYRRRMSTYSLEPVGEGE